MAVDRTVHFYASQPHFLAHILPVYRALPHPYRGGLYLRGRARHKGIPHIPGTPPRDDTVVVAASFEDYRALHSHPVILHNHGAGQSYDGDPESAGHSSYTGGRDRERVVLNLCPSTTDADRCREMGQPAVGVGVPYLDPYHRQVSWEEPISNPMSDHLRVVRDIERRSGRPPIVAFSFHADMHVCPETRWAFPHYEQAIIQLINSPDRPYDIIGHGHPRFHAHWMNWYRRHRITYFPDFSNILDLADLYVCDNSSTLFEFASTGRPVVVLDAPWYRRDVHHGGRFWDWADVGIRVQEPVFLPIAIKLALQDPPAPRRSREEVVQAVYTDLNDGRATERAVTAIIALMESR